MTVITTPIVLGEEYEDRISGFKGVATGIAEYLYGCRQVLLSKSGTGEVVADWFDEQRLIDERRDGGICTASGSKESAVRILRGVSANESAIV